MKKIPCLFVRKFHSHNSFTITEEVTPGCEWVLAGEGVATRKWDGTAVLVMDGNVYARYDAKRGKAPPLGAIPCTEAPDPVTGHWPHWVLATRQQDHWIQQAHGMCCSAGDGTYEAVGPKINGNPEGLEWHVLKRHGDIEVDVPRTFAGLQRWLAEHPWEGIVFHHPDGRMAKIRRDDFGLPWPVHKEMENDKEERNGSETKPR